MAQGMSADQDGGLLELSVPGAPAAPPLAIPDLRRALCAALADLPADVTQVLIRGAGALDGPDLPLAREDEAPTPCTLCAAVALAPRPVAVLIEGAARGRGAALAVAATWRLALPGAQLAFPEVSLGLLPGCDVTTRLPALVGAEVALRLLCSGAPIGAEEALALGLIDAVVADRDAAVAQIAALAAAGRAPRADEGRVFLRQVAAARAAFGAASPPAAQAAIDCVEAAMLLPPPQAAAFATARAAELAASPEAAALCHLAQAERRFLSAPFDLASGPALPALGVAGAEPVLAGLAGAALRAGAEVVVADPSAERLTAFLRLVALRQEEALRAGRITAEAREAEWARLTAAADPAALAGAGVVVAATAADLPPAQPGQDRLIAGRAAAALPAEAPRLTLAGRVAELGLPEGAPPPPVAWAFLRGLGLWVVPTGPQVRSGVSGRLAGAAGQAALALLGLGVAPAAVAAALAGLGLRMALPAPQEATATAQARRAMPSAELRARILAAMANEGARLIQVGVIDSAEAVDLVAVQGLGLGRSLGGPMHWADARGLLILRRDLTLWQDEGAVWAPSAGLDALVSRGRGFAGAIPVRTR